MLTNVDDETEDALQEFKQKEAKLKQTSTYVIRPKFQRKNTENVEIRSPEEVTILLLITPGGKTGQFKKVPVQDLINEVLSETLFEKHYNEDEVPTLMTLITNRVKNKMKEMEFDRYKFVVQCVIGEQRGEAVKMACRCFWDSDTDNYAQGVYVNNFLFCVTAAYGVYFY